MSTTFNTVNANSSNLYFDLHEYTSDIMEAYVAAQVAQSTAWRLDTLIVSNARQVFKAVRQELFDSGIDAVAELTNALQDAEFSAQSFVDAGLRDTGPLDAIRGLNAQRDSWHALAAHLTSMTSDYSGAPRRYETPDLESVFRAEPNLRIGTTTQRRMHTSSQRMAEAYGLGEEGAKTFLERRIQREEDNLKSISTRLVEQAEGVWFMYHNVLRSGEGDAPTEFYKLPQSIQRVLISNAQVAAQRADERACKEHGMSDSEYDRILACVLRVDGDLRKVLAGARFKVEAVMS